MNSSTESYMDFTAQHRGIDKLAKSKLESLTLAKSFEDEETREENCT